MKLTNKTILLLAAIGCGLLLGLFIILHSPLPEINDYLQKNNFQGSALIAKDGKIIFSQGFGLANKEHQIPNTPSTVFRLGSISKQFTAAAILHLMEQGKLDLHAPISSYLPNYPHGNSITIHHLLSHTSGIPSITEFANIQQIQREPLSLNQVIDTFKDLPLEFAPGSSCYYSDSGFLLLGAIIELITKVPYDKYLKEEFFEPLGMRASYYDHNRSIIPQRAAGYEDALHAGYIDMSIPHAAGALASTVEDLYKWDRALKEGAILSQESRDLLFSIQGKSTQNMITYGYGFYIGTENEEFVDAPAFLIGHYGTIEGFRAASFRYLDEDLTIILLSNNENTPINCLHIEIAKLLFKRWRA